MINLFASFNVIVHWEGVIVPFRPAKFHSLSRINYYKGFLPFFLIEHIIIKSFRDDLIFKISLLKHENSHPVGKYEKHINKQFYVYFTNLILLQKIQRETKMKKTNIHGKRLIFRETINKLLSGHNTWSEFFFSFIGDTENL